LRCKTAVIAEEGDANHVNGSHRDVLGMCESGFAGLPAVAGSQLLSE
jgi:hypothetical protein